MIASVLVAATYKDPLWYQIPDTLCSQIVPGSFVLVPLQKRQVYGYVVTTSTDHSIIQGFRLRAIIALVKLPADKQYVVFLQNVAKQYYMPWHYLLMKLINFFARESEQEKSIELTLDRPSYKEVILTDQQQAVVVFVTPFIAKSAYVSVLLHGVTGSGKTEVYKALIVQAIALGKTVILLLPEINLVLAFLQRLSCELPDVTFFGLCTGTQERSKKDLWQSLKEGRPCVVVGVHMPIFMPIPQLGLIIIDEEHELGYYEKKYPKINSKHVALIRAQTAGIPILFGSATPSLHALHQVKLKKCYFFQLNNRFAGAFPEVTVVPLTYEKKRPFFWISKVLEHEIKTCLAHKKQVILFLNRRGYAFFVQCKDCGYIFNCPDCSVSLTLHENNRLVCHYCNFIQLIDPICPSCKKEDASFLKKGIGTQQLVEMVQKLFPQAVIARADLDSTVLQKKWRATYKAFLEGSIDILVGTQTIAKGHHFPGVSLVGVIWADMNFHIPHFNATEVAIQQLIQVAGRAGRATDSIGKVIMQTIAMHDNFSYINEVNYLKLYQQEIAERQELKYPPVALLIELLLVHQKKKIVTDEADQLVLFLQKIGSHFFSTTVLGPTTPLVERIKTEERRIIYIKGTNAAEIDFLVDLIQQRKYKSKMYIFPLL
jgi:primosomal protein N' (replication factor Y)